jgi:hypothetical protein
MPIRPVQPTDHAEWLRSGSTCGEEQQRSILTTSMLILLPHRMALPSWWKALEEDSSDW